jgi:3-oxoacyl-[acyl-carrier-protein] synthase II
MDTVLVLGAPDRVAPPAPKPRGVVVTGYAAVDGHAMPRAGELVAALAWESDGDLAKAAGSDVANASEDAAPGDAIDAKLDADRARRLDRTSKLAVVASAIALDGLERGRDRDETGIVVGSAFGAVDATAAFMRRLREKGPRLVRPVDFPGLVPSSPAGYASIYLGLVGPAFVVADLAASGECAVAQAWELVAAGEVDRMIAAAVEERSAIVEEIFSVLFGSHGGESRREGAAAIAFAAEGAPGAVARVAAVTTWHDDAQATLPPRGNIEVTSGNMDVTRPRQAAWGAPIVVTAERGGAVSAILARSAWASVRRASVAEACGAHEATGGIAIAVAAAMVARGEASEALALGSARGSGYAFLLRPCARS